MGALDLPDVRRRQRHVSLQHLEPHAPNRAFQPEPGGEVKTSLSQSEAARDGELEVVAEVCFCRGKEACARGFGALHVVSVHVHGGACAPAQPGVQGEAAFQGSAVWSDVAQPNDKPIQCGLAPHDGERSPCLARVYPQSLVNGSTEVGGISELPFHAGPPR